MDHLVYGAPDVEVASAAVAGALGVTPALGGRHVGLGTYNHLLSFGDGSYLEIIGVDLRWVDVTGPRPFGVDHLDQPKLVAWAWRVDGLDAAVERAREAGWDPGDPIDLRRETPDGGELRWRLTLLRPELAGIVPFLIDWGGSAHPSTTAPGGATLAGFELVHPDVDAVQRALAAIGATAAVAPGPVPGLRARLTGPAGRMNL